MFSTYIFAIFTIFVYAISSKLAKSRLKWRIFAHKVLDDSFDVFMVLD